jgi:predicted TIM-barrel fold metal-dependent hydrolase
MNTPVETSANTTNIAQTTKKPIINCHTHIFTGDHVPPFLGRTFVPWPLYYLLPLTMVVTLFRTWYRGPYRWQFQAWYKTIRHFIYKAKMFVARNVVAGAIVFLAGLWVTVQVFFILYDWLTLLISPDEKMSGYVADTRLWLGERNLLVTDAGFAMQLTLLLIVMLFVKTGRNFIFFVLKKIWKFFALIPGPQTTALIKRYINIGRFSFHSKQEQNLEPLVNQYPDGTGFIVLPMDMEFIGAGKLKASYQSQMEELAGIKQKERYKDRFFPFVFADPRRISKEPSYFNYSVLPEGKVKLEDCFVRTYIEGHRFSGFKIYPALGYYPFDEALLPLWKYAADHGLPVLTHCIRGNIYYRGPKKNAWDYHPVFEQSVGENQYEPLLLHEIKNIHFINNFTHPLNYLCLLEEQLLRKLVAKAKDERVRELFGYTNEDTPLVHDLHHLKICFGHFGGDDEWSRFMEQDRDSYSRQLVRQPNWGIDFLTNEKGELKRGKPEQVWRSVDWYTIICSLMLQYPHVYADLSYILHNNGIHPLLKQTMQNTKLQQKVLFGTDFYVVRNHKSEKHMLADMIDELTEEEFDMLARINPGVFLQSNAPAGTTTVLVSKEVYDSRS